jgi:hypothetical protein
MIQKNAALKEVKVELTSSSITLAWFRLHLSYTSNRLQGELFFVRRTRCWFPEGLKCEYAKDIFIYKGHHFFFRRWSESSTVWRNSHLIIKLYCMT